MKKIINTFRADATNAGDWYSAPLKYFDFFNYNKEYYDFLDPPRNKIQSDVLIVGGGGLVATEEWFNLLIYWRNIVNAKIYVLWGIGIDKEYQNSKLLKLFDLVGIRQKGTIFDFVPCASCLHPIFDKHIDNKGTGDVIISHWKRIIPNSNFTNHDPFEENIKRISSATKVITTSYHIWYWAKLLKKNVIIYNSNNFKKPLAQKMFTLPDKINIDDCRSININFAKKITNLIKEKE